jgi:hypothetical protein
MIRIETVWLAVEPLDMRAGVDTALGRVVSGFGQAYAHHAHLFANRRSNRLKVIVHDGWGLWLCSRQLHRGCFIRLRIPRMPAGCSIASRASVPRHDGPGSGRTLILSFSS